MEVHFTPDELSETREMLGGRYDDLKGGRVKPLCSDEVKERLRARSAARRAEGRASFMGEEHRQPRKS